MKTDAIRKILAWADKEISTVEAEAELAALRAEHQKLESLHEQRHLYIIKIENDNKKQCNEIDALRAANKRLTKELEQEMDALKKYGKHSSPCPWLYGGPCKCGLEAALAGASTPEQPVEQDNPCNECQMSGESCKECSVEKEQEKPRVCGSCIHYSRVQEECSFWIRAMDPHDCCTNWTPADSGKEDKNEN